MSTTLSYSESRYCNHPFASASFKANHYCIATEHLSYSTKLKNMKHNFNLLKEFNRG